MRIGPYPKRIVSKRVSDTGYATKLAYPCFLALMALPIFRTSLAAVICSSVALGFLALGRAGFAVNHMDIAPKYAGIVMGVSNTAGTLAGIIGVDLTGKLLEAAKLFIRIFRIRKAGDQCS